MDAIIKHDLVNKEVVRYKQWLFGATKPREQIFPHTGSNGSAARTYSLKGNRNRKYLQYEKQRFGINLGWTNDGSNTTGDKEARWFFARQGSRNSPVLFGEQIAIGWSGRKRPYIRYEKRTWGINLTWSKKPVYEWKLLGGKIGQPVHTQDWIAIYNENPKGGQCMIYFDRSIGVGAHIGWPSSKDWAGSIKEVAEEIGREVAKEALEKASKEAVKFLLGG